jgi:hypothetical protein
MTDLNLSDEVMRYELLKLILANPTTRITDLNPGFLDSFLGMLVAVAKKQYQPEKP